MELPIRLELPEGFLEGEERCGYYVEARMKAVWAVELDLLDRFISICKRHRLQYFVCAGTLLGAMRHRGFIPWDDDIDVALPRSDYDRFISVAARELSEPYYFMNRYTDPECGRDYSQIRNSRTSGISNYWVKRKARFNYGIMIDIFPLDNVPCGFYGKVFKLLDRFYKGVADRNFYGDAKKDVLGERIKTMVAGCIYLSIGHRRMTSFREWMFRHLNRSENGQFGLTSFAPGNKRFVWDKEDSLKCMEMPFEFMKVSVPVGYDRMLRQTYGDWREYVKGGSMHSSGIYWDPYCDYKTVLKKKFDFDVDGE